MKQRIYRGRWAGCSNFTERIEELEENHNSPELKDLLERLNEGWEIKSSGKRPRIKKTREPREVIVNCFGGQVKMSFTEYKQHSSGLKVIMEIF